MSSPRSISDTEGEAGCPFLLKIFYRSGSLLRPDDFAARNPPPYIDVYAHQNCTLTELAAHLTTLSPPSLLPSPPIGTRLVFQLVYADIRNLNTNQRRYLVKDLGSVVIGGMLNAEGVDVAGVDDGKTLDDAKFVVGDYISCAVLPPLGDGAIAPASLARRGGHAARENGRLGGGVGPGGPGFGGSAAFPAGDWRRGERVPHAPARPGGGGRRR